MAFLVMWNLNRWREGHSLGAGHGVGCIFTRTDAVGVLGNGVEWKGEAK